MKSNSELEEIFTQLYKQHGGDKEGMLELNKTYTNPLAKILFIMHGHHPENENIIYYEADVIDLLNKLGYTVEWK